MIEIEHPSHYCRNGFEVWDIIERYSDNYHYGAAIKYFLRKNFKSMEVHDMQKCREELRRYKSNIEDMITIRSDPDEIDDIKDTYEIMEVEQRIFTDILLSIKNNGLMAQIHDIDMCIALLDRMLSKKI